jgi:hypothetical protein
LQVLLIPIAVILDTDGQVLANGQRSWAGHYVREILGHAGISFEEKYRPVLAEDLPDKSVVLLPWSMTLQQSEIEVLKAFVSSGGALIALGGTSGLDTVLGTEEQWELPETYLTALHNGHPVTRDLQSSLHCFEGRRIKATSGGVIARGAGAGDAIVESRHKEGWTLTFGPDLIFSILAIQQGFEIAPAIGPTRIDAVKGMVLDLDRDRVEVPDEPGNLAFLEPVADELRALIIRSLFCGLRHVNQQIPILWYWPDNAPSVAHMSHDSDGGDLENARSLLDLTREVDVKTTWCTMQGHYDRAFFDDVVAHGSEVALHYDAQTFLITADERKPAVSHLKWGYEELKAQRDALARECGQPLVTNKNHTLRWEGRLDFFKWCEQLGIAVEQSRGPNTPYSNGFPFGGCHPWFPMDDETEDRPFIDVLEIPLTVQDLNRRCSVHLGRHLADQTIRHYGVAHFLFHPNHTSDDDVRGGLRDIVGYLKDKGIPWMTAAAINQWERRRREVKFDCQDGEWHVRSNEDLEHATILVGPTDDGVTERYGYRFNVGVVDLEAGKGMAIAE